MRKNNNGKFQWSKYLNKTFSQKTKKIIVYLQITNDFQVAIIDLIDISIICTIVNQG